MDTNNLHQFLKENYRQRPRAPTSNLFARERNEKDINAGWRIQPQWFENINHL